MFEILEMAPPDPILGLNEAFRSDDNPDKINLSVGVYKDDQGKTPILHCVKEAERRLIETDTTKGYLGIDIGSYATPSDRAAPIGSAAIVRARDGSP